MVGHGHGNDAEQLLTSSMDDVQRGADEVTASGEAEDAASSIRRDSTLSSDSTEVFVASGSDDTRSARCLRCCPTIVQDALSPSGRREFKSIVKYFFPLVTFLLTTHMARFQTVILTGHMLGPVELDAVALALAYTNVTGLSIVIGLISAVETLFAQAYGSTNKKRVGIVLQQSFLVLSLVILPLSIVFLNAERVLLFSGQNAEVARLAGIFASVNYFTLFPYMVYTLGTRFLICQGKMYHTIIFGVVGNIVTLCANLLLLKVANLGVLGVSLGYLAGMISYPIVTWLYIWKRKLYTETWGGFSWESMYGWGAFSRLALSGMLMICIEWWSYEIILLLSGVLGDLEVAISVIVYQLFVITFMLPLASGIAVSIAVGNALGAGEPIRARTTSYVGLCLNTAAGLVMMVMYLLTKDYSPYIFTSCESVVEGFSSLLNFVFLLVPTDFMKAMYSGVLRGVGRQRAGAGMNLISYYLLAMPIGIPLAFLTPLSVNGMWIGMTIGVIAQVVIALTLIYRLDWDEESRKAQLRVGVEKPILLEHATTGRKRKGQRSGRLSLVSFRRLSNADCEEVECAAVESTTSSIDDSDVVETDIDAEEIVSNASALAEVTVNLDADDNALIPPSPTSSTSSSDSAAISRHRGRPTGRILLNRILLVVFCVTLCCLGVALRFLVPLHRPSEQYHEAGCPGTDSNKTTGTTEPPTPLFNETDQLSFEAYSPYSSLPRQGLFPLATQYRICSAVV